MLDVFMLPEGFHSCSLRQLMVWSCAAPMIQREMPGVVPRHKLRFCWYLHWHVSPTTGSTTFKMPEADDKNSSYVFCETMDRWTATGAVAVRAAWPTTSWIGMVVAQDCTCPWHMPSFRVGVCCMRLAHLSCCRRSCQLHVHMLWELSLLMPQVSSIGDTY